MATATITITRELLALPIMSSCHASGVHAYMNTIKTSLAPPSDFLPFFRDVPVAERPNLFIAKLRLCSHVFDFRDSTANPKEKHIKKQTLLELVDFISSGSMKITELVVEEVTKMVAANLFRALPHTTHQSAHLESYDKEGEEAILEPAWSHLQVVYEFFLLFLTSAGTEAKVARLYINQPFILKLVDLFESEDSRERQYLKTILHRIYAKFMLHRPFIRKAISNVFYRFTLESQRHHGIAEFLEILGSIINGFAVPLKEEHKIFLVKALIPLHKAKCLSMYHQQLCYCMTQFIAKDTELVAIVIKSLLKYWPLTNSQKEVLFLGEIEEILEVTQPEILQRCMIPLFRQVARCLNSLHFQVAERAFFLWNNDRIVNFVKANGTSVLPMVFPAIESSTGHWNRPILDMRLKAQKMFAEMDPELFEECACICKEAAAKAIIMKERQIVLWQRLEVLALNPR